MGYMICGIYDKRPEQCRRYPEPGSYIMDQCSFYFENGERKGECDPDCQASCCMEPRHKGEPTGPAMPEIAGGLPCKHLVYSATRPGVSSDGKADTTPEEDRGDDREELDPVELALAEINRRKGNRARLTEMGGGSGSGEGGEKG